jgi:hypothetical protein
LLRVVSGRRGFRRLSGVSGRSFCHRWFTPRMWGAARVARHRKYSRSDADQLGRRACGEWSRLGLPWLIRVALRRARAAPQSAASGDSGTPSRTIAPPA